MRKLRKILIACVVIVIMFALVGTALAYVYNGYKWPYSPSGYAYAYYNWSLSTWPTGWTTAILNGATAWNNAGAPFRFLLYDQSDSTVENGYYGSTGWLGLTTIYRLWYSPSTIYRCRMQLNRSYPLSTVVSSTTYDVQSIVTHEFGHWLSLGDLYNSTDYWKTMYGYMAKGETYKRTLHADDIAGINYIY